MSLGKNGAAHGVACGLSNPQAKLEAQTGSLEAKCLVVRTRDFDDVDQHVSAWTKINPPEAHDELKLL